MKKGMKKLTAFILLAVMLLQTLPVIAFASEESEKSMAITVNQKWGQPGDEVEVTITISDNPGFASLMLDVAYDNALTLINVEFNADLGGMCSPESDYTQAYVNPQKLVVINYSENIEFNGILATLTFKISEEAEDCHISDVTVNYDQRNITDVDRNPISVNVTNGEVAIYHGIPGDVDADGRLTGADPVLLFRYVSGWDVDVDPAAIDVDGDDFVGAWDAITLFRYVAGWEGIVLRRSSSKHVHDFAYVDANKASCTESGNVAYWHCTSCENDYVDANGNTKLDTTVIAALGHLMTYNAEKNASCTENGNIAYWHCSRCDTNFANYEGDWELNNVVIAASGHSLEKVSETSASCTSGGNVTYWYCKTCEKSYADENATVELENTAVSPAGHSLFRVAAKSAQCTVNGNIEYWYCTACQSFFSDSAAEYKIKEADTVILATGHGENLQHTAKKDATVYEGGNIEYWYCSACNCYYSDSAATNKITEAEITVPKLKSYSITFVDEKNWSDSGNYKKILIPETEDYSLVGYVPPAVNGYEFDGWYTEGGVKKFFVVAGTNVELYAKWVAIEYTITYNDAPTNNNPTTYTIEQEIIIADPEWAALKFAYWTIDSGKVVQSTSNGKTVYKIEKGTTGKIELTANWRSMENIAIPNYTGEPVVVHFDETTGRYHFLFELGTIENIVIKTIQGPSYKHKNEDLGWGIDEEFNYEESTSEEVGTTISNIISKSIESQKSFEWIQEHQETKSDEESTSVGVASNGISVEYSDTVNESITDAESFGVSISNGTTIEWGVGDETSIMSTVAYSYSYTTSVRFDRSIGGAGWPAGDYSYVQVGKAKVYAMVTYDHLQDNYYLNIYSIMADGKDATKSMIMYSPSADMAVNIIENEGLPCVIPQQYLLDTISNVTRIYFDPNKGSGTMNTQLIINNLECNLFKNAYVRDGYEFLGWSTSPAAEEAQYSDGMKINHNFCTENGDSVTLYAIWAPNKYTVHYDANGGSGSIASSECIYDVSYRVPKTGFTKDGQGLVGWSTNKNATEPDYLIADDQQFKNLTPGEDVTLYAVWKNNYIVWREGYDWKNGDFTVKDDDAKPKIRRFNITEKLTNYDDLAESFNTVEISFRFYIVEKYDGYQSLHALLTKWEIPDDQLSFNGGALNTDKIIQEKYHILNAGSHETVTGEEGEGWSGTYKYSISTSDLKNYHYLTLVLGAHGTGSDTWYLHDHDIGFRFYNK